MPPAPPPEQLTSFARWMRRLFGPVLRPFVRLHVWWWRLERADGTAYYLLPDVMSVLCLLCAIAFAAMVPSRAFFLAGPAALVCSPLLLLDLVRISRGGVLCIQLCCFVPYRIRRVPADASFDLEQAWEDPAPTGVAFSWQGARSERSVHLGTATSAHALYAAMRDSLQRQGWALDCGARLAQQGAARQQPD